LVPNGSSNCVRSASRSVPGAPDFGRQSGRAKIGALAAKPVMFIWWRSSLRVRTDSCQ